MTPRLNLVMNFSISLSPFRKACLKHLISRSNTQRYQFILFSASALYASDLIHVRFFSSAPESGLRAETNLNEVEPQKPGTIVPVSYSFGYSNIPDTTIKVYQDRFGVSADQAMCLINFQLLLKKFKIVIQKNWEQNPQDPKSCGKLTFTLGEMLVTLCYNPDVFDSNHKELVFSVF